MFGDIERQEENLKDEEEENEGGQEVLQGERSPVVSDVIASASSIWEVIKGEDVEMEKEEENEEKEKEEKGDAEDPPFVQHARAVAKCPCGSRHFVNLAKCKLCFNCCLNPRCAIKLHRQIVKGS